MTRLATALALLLLLALCLPAATTTFTLNQVITGSTPNGASPWITIKLEDTTINSAAAVKLTFNSNGLEDLVNGENQFVGAIYLNYAGSLVDLNFSAADPLSATGFAVFNVEKDANKLNTPGQAGQFDLKFNFVTSNNVPGDRFSENEIFFTNATGTDVSVANFMFKSVPKNQSDGSFYAAAHVQGIGTSAELSGTLVGGIGGGIEGEVPEPATMALVGLGLLVAGVWHRQRR